MTGVFFPAKKNRVLEVQLNTQTHQEIIKTSTCLITPSFCFQKNDFNNKTTKRQNQHNHNKNQKHITKYHLPKLPSFTSVFFTKQKSPRLTALKGAFPFADAASNSGTAPESYLAAFGHSTNGLGGRIWVFPKIGGKPPKWMVKIKENPIKMDDLGVPLFLETPILGMVVTLLETTVTRPQKRDRFKRTCQLASVDF